MIKAWNMMLVVLEWLLQQTVKKSRKIVEYGIEALKAIWHRGAVDADGKSGDGAGIQIEIAPDFFKEKIISDRT